MLSWSLGPQQQVYQMRTLSQNSWTHIICSFIVNNGLNALTYYAISDITNTQLYGWGSSNLLAFSSSDKVTFGNPTGNGFTGKLGSIEIYSPGSFFNIS